MEILQNLLLNDIMPYLMLISGLLAILSAFMGSGVCIMGAIFTQPTIKSYGFKLLLLSMVLLGVSLISFIARTVISVLLEG